MGHNKRTCKGKREAERVIPKGGNKKVKTKGGRQTVIEGGSQAPKPTQDLQQGTDEVARRRDQLTLSQIHQGTDYSIFGKIENAKTAKEAWDILKLSHKGVEEAQKSKLQSLHRKYERYEMSNSKTVEQYFSRVINLVNKMRVKGEDIPYSKLVEKIQRMMPMKFDQVVTIIIESHNTDTLYVAELQGSIESHVNRILEKTKKVKKEVKILSIEEEEIIEAEAEEIMEEEDVATLTNGETIISIHPIKEEVEIILDTTIVVGETISDSTIVVEEEELFSSLNEMVKSTVKFGNNSYIPILGKGRISTRLKDGTQNFIGDVFYAPGLHHNLLSIGQLSEKSYNMQIHNGFAR
ncbi:uncharacterized protein LOC131613206 [Vicia villosa]|uniref:uncharacterized protein LOC131613206 n=1 Tax=Vicia villosa TaxID=3911 RepID=UPI00273C1C5E|nr:uncharacterized protein LOC131613206 [Vicia villosa]